MGKQREFSYSLLLRELVAVDLYKWNQGRMARQLTGSVFALAAALASYQLYNMLGADGWSAKLYLQYIVPLTLLAAGFWLSFRLINLPAFADFLIATEAEMKKVSWPAKGELLRGTTVVLVVMFSLAIIVFGYDLVWIQLFRALGVLYVDPNAVPQ